MAEDPEALRRMSWKRDGVLACAGSITTLVLGSSHGDQGFNPKYFRGSYNLCSPSQDLANSLILYEWADQRLDRLRSIILFYSVFSAGFSADDTSERKHSDINRLLFSGVLPAYGGTEHAGPPEGFRGYDPYRSDAIVEAAPRVASHLRYSAVGQFDCAQHPFLEILLERVLTRGQRLIVVIAPARPDYVAALKARHKEVFGPIKALARARGIEVIDLFRSSPLGAGDFDDTDHPNMDGARVLTRVIRRRLWALWLARLPPTRWLSRRSI